MTSSEAEWHTIEDSAQRRKIQSRINQRLSRQRRAQRGDGEGGIVIKQWIAGPTAGSTSRSRRRGERPSAYPNEEKLKEEQSMTVACKFDAFEGKSLESFQKFHGHNARYCQRQSVAPADHRLLNLIYYNAFRGFYWNIEILGLDIVQMFRDEYQSPLTPLSPSASSAITRLPPSLHPTALQRQREHHPFLDIFPCPMFRDNVLQHYLLVDDDEGVCNDIMGFPEEGSIGFLEFDEGPRIGCTLCGDPWEITNWEISEYVAKKWACLFKGAFELQASTNARRK